MDKLKSKQNQARIANALSLASVFCSNSAATPVRTLHYATETLSMQNKYLVDPRDNGMSKRYEKNPSRATRLVSRNLLFFSVVTQSDVPVPSDKNWDIF